MREIRTSGSMSGDGKRGAGHWPQATAPILDSTCSEVFGNAAILSGYNVTYTVPAGPSAMWAAAGTLNFIMMVWLHGSP
jgi:hypothetical protein